MAKPERCSRCDGELVEGYIVDTIIGADARSATWAQGRPKKALLSGVMPSSGLDPVPITTYRCKECGLLESYVEASSE